MSIAERQTIGLQVIGGRLPLPGHRRPAQRAIDVPI